MIYTTSFKKRKGLFLIFDMIVELEILDDWTLDTVMY